MIRNMYLISGCLAGIGILVAVVPTTVCAQTILRPDAVWPRGGVQPELSKNVEQPAAKRTGIVAPSAPSEPAKPSQSRSLPAVPVSDGEIAPLPPNSNAPATTQFDTPKAPESVLAAAQPAADISPPINALAAGQGASTAMSHVPSFLGDFFAKPGSTVSLDKKSEQPINLRQPVSTPVSTAVGIMKLAENTSPLPRDRVFLSYNYFNDVQLTAGGINVNRFTPGIEKTFFNGNASVEIRAPLAATLGSTTSVNQAGTPIYSLDQVEFGNLTTFFKALLWRDETIALSTGLGFSAPTANDIKVQNFRGEPISVIKNQAWHLLPFVGAVYTPDDRWFAQAFLQLDVAANDNSVYSIDSYFGSSVGRDGGLHDPLFLFASLGGGYWLYQTANPNARLSRVSLVSELHFNSTLEPANPVVGPIIKTGEYLSQIQTVNAVVGANVMFDDNKSLLMGYVTPLGSSDMSFAGELRVIVNIYFGGSQSRAGRVQF